MKKKLAVQYLTKFPNKNNKELARMLSEDHPKVYDNIEQARWHVRNNRDKGILPRILVFDIETLPIVAYTWGVWNVNILPKQIIKDWCMLSWSAKWLLTDEVYGEILTQKEVKNRDDKRISSGIWNMINQADIVIAHNGDKFDIRKVKSRWLKHGLNPPSSYRSIDTLKVLKGFSPTYRKLDFINKELGLDVKLPMDWDDWRKCDEMDQEALDKMMEYNKEDVKILEELYLIIRPWINSHPNLGLFQSGVKDVCATCGSENIHVDGGYYYTAVGKYSTLRCECGAISRSRFTALSKDQRKHLLSSTAR